MRIDSDVALVHAGFYLRLVFGDKHENPTSCPAECRRKSATSISDKALNPVIVATALTGLFSGSSAETLDKAHFGAVFITCFMHDHGERDMALNH